MHKLIALIVLAAAVLGVSGCTHPGLKDSAVVDDRYTAVAAVLDDFHDAASKADEERYFAHFAPLGVFIGTDATEHWTVEEFRAYAHPSFSQGKGWTYRSTSRVISFARDERTAWFDELLVNEKWGVCRGSGVLVRRSKKEEWKIAQYNLSVPIPNDLLPEVAGRIKSFEDAKK